MVIFKRLMVVMIRRLLMVIRSTVAELERRQMEDMVRRLIVMRIRLRRRKTFGELGYCFHNIELFRSISVSNLD